jgi:FkbM family methyltransferase
MPNTFNRNENICGVGPWVWLEGDSGCWTGPSREFEMLRDMCLRHVRGRRTVLQAGGALGMYPRLWAETFEKVVTVEPCPDSFAVLAQNCNYPKIHRIQAALGETNGTTILHRYGPSNVGMHSITRANQGGEDVIVPMIRIDDLELENLDLIQLDVEGAEGLALLGAWNALSKHRPVVAVETVDETVRTLLENQLNYKSVENVSSICDRVFRPAESSGWGS